VIGAAIIPERARLLNVIGDRIILERARLLGQCAARLISERWLLDVSIAVSVSERRWCNGSDGLMIHERARLFSWITSGRTLKRDGVRDRSDAGTQHVFELPAPGVEGSVSQTRVDSHLCHCLSGNGIRGPVQLGLCL
jgi:hypothetical protein